MAWNHLGVTLIEMMNLSDSVSDITDDQRPLQIYRHHTLMDSFPILQLIISFIYDIHRDCMKRKLKPIQVT